MENEINQTIELLFVMHEHDELQTHLPAFSHSALHEHFPVAK